MQGTQSGAKLLALLQRITLDGGRTPASLLIAQADLSPATGRRMLGLLTETGMITRIARGRYAGGEQLRQLAARVSPHARLVEVARPLLRRLAEVERATAYLGVFEGEMVTYLIKEGDQDGFTREQMQLEAYCTGIGKVLLAQLAERRLATYLAAPMVALTPQTITDPHKLRLELQHMRERGYAVDDREMAENLCCVAAPLRRMRGSDYAISLSGRPGQIDLSRSADYAARLQRCADRISSRLEP